ncbi:peptidase M16 inactive domain protein [Roseovarius sp. A-2]|uniref:M16 family metallopeptidase n=1 Tax=Roseovarius sp. A-2 TaxID=1570360 RepID=UPI0009D40856|nr:pitrilysin family protein [Roseovarius sp. A-2]GAW36190.1 peptidase M16 inactive domain protein [Roseovarius sp. A-2]
MIRVLLSLFLVIAALPARAEVDIKEVTTPGGLSAWLVEDHSIPFVALELRFRGGASLDREAKQGATNLMVGLLEEGAGDMDAQGFARTRDALAAKFSYDVSDDAVSVSARMLTENRAAALDLLRASLVEPSFAPDAVERVRQQVLSGLRSAQTDPRSLMNKAMDRLVFGDHPYGSQLEGTIASVESLTRQDIAAAHARALTRDRVYISAVGDITEAELAILLDGLLGDLPQEGAPLPAPADLNLPGGIEVVPFETPQSVAAFAQPGVDREDADFFAAFVLNHILGGGGFESRLMTEVREKRGLTYGVYSYLADKDAAQLWMGSVASANDRMAEAISVIRDEWARIREKGVTAEELQDAKTYLTGAFPLRFEGNGPIAAIAVGMQMDGLPPDYIANRNDMVNAVTLDQINRVARERLDPEALTFVVVGQPDGLDGQVN